MTTTVPDYSNAPDELFAAPIYMPVVLNFEIDKSIMFGHGGNPYVSLYSQEAGLAGRVSSEKAAYLTSLPGRAEEAYLPRMDGADELTAQVNLAPLASLGNNQGNNQGQ
jgi:hypothetical protein